MDPLFAAYYAVPHFVFYPIFIVLFGMTRVPLVVLGLPVRSRRRTIVNTMNGLDRIPRVLLKVARTSRLDPVRTAWFIVLLVDRALPLHRRQAGGRLLLHRRHRRRVHPVLVGIGHQIAYAYDNFDNRTMYGLLLFILGLVTFVNMSLWTYEQRLMRRRSRG